MKHNNIILHILIILTFNSCTKDFLDVKNTLNLYRESYVKDLTSMQEYVNGIYVLLGTKIEGGTFITYPEIAADNIRPLSVTSPTEMIDHYNWAQKADDNTNYLPLILWFEGYKTIRVCNFVIEEVDKYRNENPTKSDNLKGQAYALRAYLFFRLVNTFAQPYKFTDKASHPGVPYITTSDITKSYTRQTVAEVYESMIIDLNKAIQLLASTAADTRFMNQNAAKALLARVYLFMEDYSAAQKTATEIVNKVPLMTINEGYPTDIFKLRSPAKTESLFQISPYNGVAGPTYFINFYFRAPSLSFLATSDISRILQENPNDIRQTWVNSISGDWNITKFPIDVAPEITPPLTIPPIAYYPSLIRSSEMFLTAAEAAAKTGDENTARIHLDAIRKRSDPTISPVTATGTALLDSIYKERRKELSFEGLRMYDILRLKQTVHRTDVLPGSPSNLSFPNDKAISPIPVQEVKVSGIPQNKSY